MRSPPIQRLWRSGATHQSISGLRTSAWRFPRRYATHAWQLVKLDVTQRQCGDIPRPESWVGRRSQWSPVECAEILCKSEGTFAFTLLGGLASPARLTCLRHVSHSHSYTSLWSWWHICFKVIFRESRRTDGRDVRGFNKHVSIENTVVNRSKRIQRCQTVPFKWAIVSQALWRSFTVLKSKAGKAGKK